MQRTPSAGRRIRLPLFWAWVMLTALFCNTSAAAPEAAKPPPAWEVAGFLAALRDPDDQVVLAAARYPRAVELLASNPQLDTNTLSRLLGLWGLQLESAAQNIPLLAATPSLAQAADERVAQALANGEPDTRLAAVEFYAQNPELARGRAALLSQRLADPSSRVRAAALELLRGHPEWVEIPTKTLSQWLRSDHSLVRHAAVRAFTLRPELVAAHASALSARLGDTDSNVRAAARALLQQHPAWVDLPTDTLLAWLGSDDWWVQLGAVLAAALPNVVAEPVPEAIAIALSTRLGDWHPDVRSAARDLLRQHPAWVDLPADTLLAWLHSDVSEMQLLAVRAAALPGVIAEPVPKAIAIALSARLGDTDSQVRAAAGDLLQQHPDWIDLPADTFLAWLRSDDESVRLDAILAAALPGVIAEPVPEAIAIMLNARLGDTDSEMSGAVLELMQQHPAWVDLSADTLLAWLHSDNGSVRYGAVRAAALPGVVAEPVPAAITTALKTRLGDTDSYVGAATLDLLQQHPAWVDLTPGTLLAWLRSDDESVRHGAVRAAALPGVVAEPVPTAIAIALTARLGDADPNVRAAALDLLQQHPAWIDLPADTLLAWLRSDDGAVRFDAVHAAALPGAVAKPVPAAIAIALSARLGDTHSNVSTAALELLQQHPAWVDLSADTLLAWLRSEDGSVRYSAILAAALPGVIADPVPSAIAIALSTRLGDRESFVGAVALDLLWQHPAWVDLPADTLLAWLRSDDWQVRRGAVIATTLPGLVAEPLPAPIAIRLSALLGDRHPYVSTASLELLQQHPAWIDLSVGTLLKWLGNEDRDIRLGAVRAAALPGAVAEPIPSALAIALTARLGDTDSDVRAAARDLLQQHPAWVDLPVDTLLAWLGSDDWQVRFDAILAAALPGVVAEPASTAIAIALIARLGDRHPSVSAATLNLLQQHPAWVVPATLAQALASDYATEALSLLHRLGLQSRPTLMPLLETVYTSPRSRAQLRLAAHVLGGGADEDITGIEPAIRWLAADHDADDPLTAARSDHDAASSTLTLFAALWSETEGHRQTRRDLARHIRRLIDATEDDWSTMELPSLIRIRVQLGDAGLPTGDIDQAISKIEAVDWLTASGKLIAAHALFWALLVGFYPRFPLVQALFFWNPWVRHIAGLGYVGLLLAWVPWLRRILFSPFRDSLLSDAALEGFDDAHYYPNSLARLSSDSAAKAQPVVEAIPRIKGQIVLVGDSGLGKTMFLRHRVATSRRVTAYLPAWKCDDGVLEALQAKLHGPARDPDYLRTLVYAGAIDLCIDGVNEVSPDTREKIRSFVENFFKGNIILGIQPIDWRPPSTAAQWCLEPLSEAQIGEFLASRPLPAGTGVAESDQYASACQQFLSTTLGADQPTEAREANRRVLSNPMDATVVAAMLMHGDNPDLFQLQQQQYDIMAADYAARSAGQDFPLSAFSERVYQMRCNDISTIPEADFPREVKALVDHKMAIVLQFQDGSGDAQKQWRFRHDKVMDFFIVQAFLGEDNARPAEHLGDARFRSVYFLLAQLMPLDAAEQLCEQLIQYAADSKDHSVSDSFVQRLRVRQAPQGDSRQDDA